MSDVERKEFGTILEERYLEIRKEMVKVGREANEDGRFYGLGGIEGGEMEVKRKIHRFRDLWGLINVGRVG